MFASRIIAREHVILLDRHRYLFFRYSRLKSIPAALETAVFASDADQQPYPALTIKKGLTQQQRTSGLRLRA